MYDQNMSLHFAGMHTDGDELYFLSVSDCAYANVLLFLYKSVYLSSVDPQIASHFSHVRIGASNFVAEADLGTTDPTYIVFAACATPDLLEQPLFPHMCDLSPYSTSTGISLVQILRDALVGFCSNSISDLPLALQCSFNIVMALLRPHGALDPTVLFVSERIYQSVYAWLYDFAIDSANHLSSFCLLSIMSHIQRICPQVSGTSFRVMDPIVLQAVQDTVRNAFDETKALLCSDASITDSVLRDAFVSALPEP